jgi:putative addiction module killer protein
MGYQLEIYKTSNGKKPFDQWFKKLKDFNAKALILARIDRIIKFGNFGDTGFVGDGISEWRFHIGPGYRVYYIECGARIVVILCGGAKGSQNKDIEKAKQYLLDFKKREM